MVTDAMVTIDPHLATSNHFDLSKAMEPVVNVAWSPLLLATANNVPANSVAELVRAGQAKDAEPELWEPGQLDAAPARRRDAAEIRRLHHDPHSLQGNVGCP